MRKTVLKKYDGRISKDGAGVTLKRIFGYHEVPGLDPFLLLDFFDSKNPEDYIAGFPWHPHRGIETVTYLIHGKIEHGDSLGNRGVIEDGGCQWMTAGSGIIHQEMPKPAPHMKGLQLWINLPAKDKMTTPAYRDIIADTLPIIRTTGAEVRILCGEFEGNMGPVEGTYVKPTFIDVTLEGEATFERTYPEGHTVICVALEGSGVISEEGDSLDGAGATIKFSPAGSMVRVDAKGDGFRFLLISAEPLDEPVAWGGPIVMNTKDELNDAFREIDEGTFIK